MGLATDNMNAFLIPVRQEPVTKHQRYPTALLQQEILSARLPAEVWVLQALKQFGIDDKNLTPVITPGGDQLFDITGY